MSKTPKRNIRIDNDTWEKLKKKAKPESISALIREALRDLVSKD